MPIRLCRVFVAWMLLVYATAPHAAQSEAAPVTEYGAAFFAQAQPYSAFDMLMLLPGYKFSDIDPDIRGYADAAGNVLIDGSRPASKHETLEALLRRIPAGTVDHIELIRAGAPGIDMQGQSVLANIVRVRDLATRSAVEIGEATYRRGFHAPRVAGEFSRQSGDKLFELSGALYRTVDDEHGSGTRPRVAADGAILRDGRYSQDEGARIAELATNYQSGAGEGNLRVHAALRQEKFAAHIVDDRVVPAFSLSTGEEFKDKRNSELSAHYERPLSDGLQLEVFGIQRNARERGGERSVAADERASSREDSDASESIVRGTLRLNGDRLALEGGLETALNILDSHSGLTENGIEIPLPAADVRVEELRGEAFATATWRISSRWLLESGLRFERSQLSQSGDSSLGKTFFFTKPRALLSWAPTSADQWRLLVEREVGQLDFGDFVSSASLTSQTVTAGNPDLEPDQTWRTELAWERHFTQGAAFVLAARHEQIADLVDRIPIAGPTPFDGIGNIGAGERNEFELNLTLPMQWRGLPPMRVKIDALWRDSRATDPATGESRRISGDAPLEATGTFTQDLPRWQAHWGFAVELARTETEYRFNEIRTDRLGTSVDAFVEFEPAPAWNVRLELNNLTDRAAERKREIFSGVRGSAPLDYIEIRTLRIEPYARLSVRRVFGGSSR
ncbi:MAG: hypothetical protein CMLOHMNK_01358 [Steroidobacteraceae bacterium]|nr:hypothetical protein [Steroidobacteraceae bacterium]